MLHHTSVFDVDVGSLMILQTNPRVQPPDSLVHEAVAQRGGDTRWRYQVEVPGGGTRWRYLVEVPGGGRHLWSFRLHSLCAAGVCVGGGAASTNIIFVIWDKTPTGSNMHPSLLADCCHSPMRSC